MARKAKDHGPEVAAYIASAVRRSESPGRVAKATGVSLRTVERLMAAERCKPAQAQTPHIPETIPEVPDELPDGVDLATVDKWIPLVEKAAQRAYDAENDTAFAALTARLVTLLEHKRKATPPPKIDLNDSPDMIAAADRALARLEHILEIGE